jgi:phosphohistidine phosphatase
MRLWLMRHGEAADPDGFGSDDERTLTERGRRQVAAVATWLAGRTELPDAIWHSPLVRTRETAETVAAAWGAGVTVQVSPELAPGMRLSSLLKELAEAGREHVLCIGHQPDIGAAIEAALGGGRFQVAPGTIACLHFPGELVREAGVLEGYLHPGWFVDR